MEATFYDLRARTTRGEEVPMSLYKGKVVLVVNTATQCGLAPQFKGLEKLHTTYSAKGLAVLGFPSDQFMHQEPETNDSMEQTCQLNFGVSFQLFEKCDVNGAGTHPVFKFLKHKLKGWFGSNIKWNFTKFLVDANGVPVKRYSPLAKPQEIEKDIVKLLGNETR